MIKNIVKILGIASLLAISTFASKAQTAVTTTNASGGVTTVSNLSTNNFLSLLGAAGESVGGSVLNFLESNSTNKTITVESGALHYGSKYTKDFGGFVDVQFPSNGTNSILSTGFGLAYLNHEFYDASLNVRLGANVPIPFLTNTNTTLYVYGESGPELNLSNIAKGSIGAQSFAGAIYKWSISTSSYITVGAAIGSISDISGAIVALGGSYTWTF